MNDLGKLSFVATPIGNLTDITYRAIETLTEADIVLAEDTRVTKKLFDRYSITTPLKTFHHHSTDNAFDAIIKELAQGKHIALVTDAGTPGISDPGNRLTQKVFEYFGDTITIEPIPGASALTAALSIAGVPTDRFTFYGFIPHKKGRLTFLKNIAEDTKTAVFFESPHRILKTLSSLESLIDKKRKVIVTRELTKKFETIYRGSISEVLQEIKKNPKGEFTVIISAL